MHGIVSPLVVTGPPPPPNGLDDATGLSLVTSGDFATGNRHGVSLTVTYTLTSSSWTPLNMFDGTYTSNFYPPAASHNGQWVQIDHGVGESVAPTRVRIEAGYAPGSILYGYPKMQLSQDAVTWTDITPAWAFYNTTWYAINDGSWAGSGDGSPNNWSGRYWRMIWTDATAFNSYMREMEFEGRRFA